MHLSAVWQVEIPANRYRFPSVSRGFRFIAALLICGALATSTNGYSRSHSYDTLGRASSTSVTIGSEIFTTSVSYDASGRLAQTQYPAHGVSGVTAFAVNHVYNGSGGSLRQAGLSGDR